MIQSLEAIFDGEAFQPEVPLNMKAGTRVRLIVESVVSDEAQQPKSFLQTAKSGSSGINMLNQIHLTDLHGFQPSGKALKCFSRTFTYRILKSPKSLRLEGEPNWSTNIDQSLYGETVSEND